MNWLSIIATMTSKNESNQTNMLSLLAGDVFNSPNPMSEFSIHNMQSLSQLFNQSFIPIRVHAHNDVLPAEEDWLGLTS